MSDPRVRLLLQFWQMHDTLPHEFCRDRIAPLIVSRLEFLWHRKSFEPHDDEIFAATLRQEHEYVTARMEIFHVQAWQLLTPAYEESTPSGAPQIPHNERWLSYSVRGREVFHTLKMVIDRTRGEQDLLHERALDALWTATERPPTPEIVARPPVVDLRAHL